MEKERKEGVKQERERAATDLLKEECLEKKEKKKSRRRLKKMKQKTNWISLKSRMNKPSWISQLGKNDAMILYDTAAAFEFLR